MTKPNPNQETMEEMLRVDHAGEYGANRIYEGQLMVLGKTALAPTLKHMLEQEQEHLKKFDQLLNENKVRPSLLMPVWHVAGLALGVGSALLGKKAAMACTVAVEEAIEEHYNSQIELIEDEELKKTITKFRDEEVEHKDIALHNEAKQMKGYALFSGAIKLGAKASIFLAKKICILALIGIPLGAEAGRLDEGISAIKKGNYQLAVNIVRPLAAAGDPDAQFTLCGMYYNAQGVPKNDYEASRWCHAAAKNGNVEAMFNLALLYQNGEGVAQNFMEAKKWYHSASERGHKDASFNLAELNGTNGRIAKQMMMASATSAPAPAMAMAPQQAPQAAPQMMMAAAPAPVMNAPVMSPSMMAAPVNAAPVQMAAPMAAPVQMASAPLMVQETITPAPMPAVQSQPIRAAQKAPAPVQVASLAPTYISSFDAIEPAAGNMPGTVRSEGKVVRIVPDNQPPIMIVDPREKAADPYAACILAAQRGEIYDICTKGTPAEKTAATAPQQLALNSPVNAKDHSFDFGSDLNFSTALELAKKGDVNAQNELGSIYRSGKGIARNYGEAIKWFEKAASKGHVQAMMNLAQMYREGTGVATNPQLAYSWYNLAADRSKTADDKSLALANVSELSRSLSNEQIGNALQYVTKLDERIPQI